MQALALGFKGPDPVLGELGEVADESPDLVCGMAGGAENPDGHLAEIMGRRYLVDPDVTMTSYSTVTLHGCSATLIGPNILLTASHCGYHDHHVRFRAYPMGSNLDPQGRDDLCHPLYQTYDDTDLMLLYCPAVDGINPGDAFGYLDLEDRPPQVGDEVYNLWSNSVLDITGPNLPQLLYSEGEVSSTSVDGWYVPDAHPNTGVLLEMFGVHGASGSADMTFDRHRILTAPASVGQGTARFTSAAVDTVSRTEVAEEAYVNDSLISALGLDPSDYLGLVDKDGDLRFDIQTDLERLTGESAREHYAFNFESARQNTLWSPPTPGPAVEHNTDDGVLHLHPSAGAGMQTYRRHERLNLKQGTTYRVSVEVRAHTDDPDGLEIAIQQRELDWTTTSSEFIDLDPAEGWTTHVFELKTPELLQPAIAIRKLVDADVELRAFDVIEHGATMDFDTHDTRLRWRNGNTGRRAFVLPDGNGAVVDWAGLVLRTDGLATGNDWPLVNEQLAIVPGREYRLCFQVMKMPGGAEGSDVEGSVRITSGGNVAFLEAFDVVDESYVDRCTAPFEVASPGSSVAFGIVATPPDQGFKTSAGYLVDDIILQEL